MDWWRNCFAHGRLLLLLRHWRRLLKLRRSQNHLRLWLLLWLAHDRWLCRIGLKHEAHLFSKEALLAGQWIDQRRLLEQDSG